MRILFLQFFTTLRLLVLSRYFIRRCFETINFLITLGHSHNCNTSLPSLYKCNFGLATFSVDSFFFLLTLYSFDEWTCWSLLLMLALYDLCAVLTPCGPLKMLVGLMQERNEPLPGLLYEANLPPPTDYSQNRPSRQYQESTTIPSPMSLGVGMGFGSWAIMMGTSGYVPPGEDDDHHNSPANSDYLSQASSDAGADIETSGHGLLPSVSNTSGNISLTEPPIVRRKPTSSTAPVTSAHPHYDGRGVEITPPEEEFDKGTSES